jgi:long-chain acyl-CoA synthetase
MRLQSSTNLADVFHALASRYQDRIAMTSAGRQLSFAGLTAEAARWGSALRQEGLGPGDQIGIALRDGLETIVAILATWMIDAVAVPIDFRTRGEERTRLMSEFDLKIVVEDRRHLAADYQSILCDKDWAARVAKQSSTPLERNCDQSYPAFISLTSGTTGRPIGIVMGHRTLLLRSLGYGLETHYPADGAFLNAYPLSFSASRNHTLGQLMRGATVHFHPPIFSPGELIENVNRIGATFLFAVPATVTAMLGVANTPKAPVMPSLQVLYCGGSGMLPDEKRRAIQELSPGFLHCFSSSISGTCSVLSGQDVLTHSHTDGRVLPSVRLEVVDEEDRVMPHGEVGSMRVRSHGMAEGLYHNTVRDTGDKLRDGWAYTGDLARLSGDGFLSVVGRTTDLIIRSGANVHPAEVEYVLSGMDGIREVAVTGFSVGSGNEEIAAFVVCDPELSQGALEAHCRVQLAPDKRPRHFIFVDSLPRNANGKLLRRALRERLEKDMLSAD